MMDYYLNFFNDIDLLMNLQWIEDQLSNEKDALEFIIEQKLIDNCQICQNFHEPVEMIIIHDSHIKIKHIWRCPLCKKYKSLLNGSIFQDSKLPIKTVMKIIYAWSNSFSGKHASQEIGVSEHTISSVYSEIEDACYQFITREDREKVGGPGLSVEIDETLLTRRKYNTGRLQEQIWVFGGICRENSAKFLEFVPNRNSDT